MSCLAYLRNSFVLDHVLLSQVTSWFSICIIKGPVTPKTLHRFLLIILLEKSVEYILFSMCPVWKTSLYISLFLIVLIPSSNGIFYDYDDSDNSTESIDLLSLFSFRTWLNYFLLGEKPNCGPPKTCPNYPCKENPAVLHGYCCGCASPFERIPYLCALDTKCPLALDRLCDEFDYIIDCCCPQGIQPDKVTPRKDIRPNKLSPHKTH